MLDESIILGYFAIWGILVLVFLAVGIVMYVLASLGLYRLAANRGIENAWLAWIPIGNLYILGKVIGELYISSLEIPKIELVLPLGCIASGLLGSIPVIGWLISIAYAVLFVLVFYRLYTMYRPESAVLWIILSIILPFMGPIFLFIMRNDTPVF